MTRIIFNTNHQYDISDFCQKIMLYILRLVKTNAIFQENETFLLKFRSNLWKFLFECVVYTDT